MKKFSFLAAIAVVLGTIALFLTNQADAACMMLAGPVVISPDRMRSIFTNLKSFRDQGFITVPGFFRVESLIKNGQSKYSFPIQKDSNSDQLTESKLDRNDKFMLTHLGLFLMKRLTTKPGIEVLQTYPNIQEFADDSTNFLGADLEAFYNGHMSLKVGQTTFIERLDTRRFRAIEDTQQSSASTKSSARENSGFIEMTPQVMLEVDQKIEIAVEAPTAFAKVQNTVANTNNYLVLVGRGFLITRK